MTGTGNQHVTSDDLLNRIDDSNFRARVEEVNAELARCHLVYRYLHSQATSKNMQKEAGYLREYSDYLSKQTTKVEEASKSQVDEFLIHSRDANSLGGASLRHMIGAIQRLYGHIHAQVENASCVSVSQISQLKREHDLSNRDLSPDPLATEQVRRLVEHTVSDQDAIVIRLMYENALTTGEIRNLNLSDFNPAKQTLAVTNPSHERYRRLPLLAATSEEMEQWLNSEYESSNQSANPVLFQSRQGTPKLTPAAVYKKVTRTAGYAEIQENIGELGGGRKRRRVSPHVVRRTGIHHWRKNGLPEDIIQRLLGNDPSESGQRTASLSENDVFEMYRNRFESPLD